MGRYKDLVSDTLVIGIGNFTTKLIYFFLMPIYTLYMSAEEFGEADLLNNLAALLLPVFSLSIAEGVFRYALDKKENSNELLSVGLNIINRCSFVAAICVSTTYWITKEQYWLYFFPFFITEAYRSLLAQFSRGVGCVRNFSICGIIAAIVLFCATYLLVKTLSLGVKGYLIAFVVANVSSILYLIFTVPSIRGFAWKHSSAKSKEILMYSLPLIPNTLSWWATNVSSRYILAYHCGIALAGVFAATSKLPALINIVTSVFQQSWQISSIKQSEAEDRISFYGKVFEVYSSFVFVSGSLLIVFIPIISKFVLKGDFYNAWSYTPLLLFSAILGCFSVYFGNFYTIEKNSKSIMKTTLYGAISNVILCLILIPIWNIYGALIANVSSFGIIVFARYVDTRKNMPIRFNKLAFYISLVLLLAECLISTIYKTTDHVLVYICVIVVIGLNCLPFIKMIKHK